LEIRQKVLGRDHLEALLDLHDLAIIRMRRGYITNAIDLMSQCFSRMDQTVGPEDKWTIFIKNIVSRWEMETKDRDRKANSDELRIW
jgi:hypothetical protein